MSKTMRDALAERAASLPEESEPIEVGPAPDDVLQGVRKALMAGETHYTDRPGIRELREKVASRLGLTADEVVITNGVREGRFVTKLALGEVPDDVTIASFDDLPGLASFRVGYVAAPAEAAKKIRSLKQALSICTAAPSQRAVLVALAKEDAS